MSLLPAILPPSLALWGSVTLGGSICWLAGQRDGAHYRDSLPLVLLNVGCIQLGIVVVCAMRQAWNPFWDHHTLWMYLLWLVTVDALGWLGHALMHASPSLAPLHVRVHHRKREPYGIDQFYQHPLDDLVLFILPGLLTVGLLPMDVSLFAWGIGLIVLGNVLSHGPFGWEHRRHHLGERVSLGGGVWFDWAMGTSKDTLRHKLRHWVAIVALYQAWVRWKWALLLAGVALVLVVAFKLTLYFVTELAWLRSGVWRTFYGVLDRLLRWTGNEGFDTLNWGWSATAEGSVEHPRELHLALYERVVGREPARVEVLEVGSGRGGGAFHLVRSGLRRLTALDLSPRHVRRCKRIVAASGPNAAMPRFLEGSAESMPVPDASFDVVLNVESSHCYPSFARFLDECARVLRPGGRLRWCDFRTREDWARLRAELAQDARWLIREEEDLTRGVLCASERLRPWYLRRLRIVRWIPPLYETLHNFALLPGSRNHRMLAEGEWVYMRLVLIRRADDARAVRGG